MEQEFEEEDIGSPRLTSFASSGRLDPARPRKRDPRNPGLFTLEQRGLTKSSTLALVILSIFGSALRAWWDDDAPRLGASLAYYTLFAIAPVLLVATAIAGMVFGAEAVRGEIVGQLDQLVGHEGAHAVQGLLEGASQRRAG